VSSPGADLALRLRRATERSASGLRATLAAHGFGELPASGGSLLCLVAARGAIATGDAAAALGVTPAAVSQASSALQKGGWLREQSGARDARVRQLALGPRALEQADSLHALRRALDAAWREALGAHAQPLELALQALERALAAESLPARTRRHA
jgi:DNA-binding MarR family transcriptional regulator